MVGRDCGLGVTKEEKGESGLLLLDMPSSWWELVKAQSPPGLSLIGPDESSDAEVGSSVEFVVVGVPPFTLWSIREVRGERQEAIQYGQWGCYRTGATDPRFTEDVNRGFLLHNDFAHLWKTLSV
ncbi:hypothetical protein EYF80_016878 [Liparis tanakae]|uniref:Uncharacterized protein n=1 Tax=Liparis tanakae TaxID=230148 RepID=A0A4Z2I4F4_9TELE|nr:hypothetical protein EYF80_016878 [Liparis tanakae]